jgi:hypothetical protein
MKLSTFGSLASALLINWLVIPGFTIFIGVKAGFLMAVLFFVAIIVLDSIWEFIAGSLVTASARPYVNRSEEFENSQEIPLPVAAWMIVRLVGHLALPWIFGLLLLARSAVTKV